MTPAERSAFLEERKAGLGGSDIGSLLQPYISEVKYGCQRRLWYDKSGIAPDYPQEDSGPMELGRILEPHIARWHEQATGDELTSPGLIVHPAFPELLVHIDRGIRDYAHSNPGVAEIKALGPDMFWETKRNGLLVEYVLQLQHGMLCSRLEWGKFIVGNRAYGGTPLHWTHDKEPEIHEAILDVGPEFWKTLGNPDMSPPRLELDDKRCASCQWRRSCQGNALMDVSRNEKLPVATDLQGLLAEYDHVNALFCEKLSDGNRGTADQLRMQEIKDQIRAVLADRDAVVVPTGAKDRKVYYRAQEGRTSWQMESLIQSYEKLRGTMRAEMLDNAAGDTQATESFDVEYPPAESFARQGLPFRVLRIY